MERVGVIETPSSDWKSEVLPLNYTRVLLTTDQHSEESRSPTLSLFSILELLGA